MKWKEKVEMCELMNNGNYSDAVNFIKEKEMDREDMDLFMNFFDLTKVELLLPIKDAVLSFDSGTLGFRGRLRLESAKDELKKIS